MSTASFLPARSRARRRPRIRRLAAWVVASASDPKASLWLVIGFAAAHAALWTLVLANLKAAQDVPLSELKDPAARVMGGGEEIPATDAARTKPGHEQWLVAIGICTHLGCIPKGQRPGDDRGEYGGWFCPCHGSNYDTAGRIRKGPAPRNLEIPPYAFETDTKIKIG